MEKLQEFRTLLGGAGLVKKEEEEFLKMHEQLIREIIIGGSKYAKGFPDVILHYRKTIASRIENDEKREQSFEGAYKSMRRKLVRTLEKTGANKHAAFLMQNWTTIEQTLRKLQGFMDNPNSWISEQGRQAIYQVANVLLTRQNQIVAFLTQLEQMVKSRLESAGARV